MKHYTGVKPLSVIRAQCKEQGVAVDDFNYREHYSDYIALGPHGGFRPDGSPFVHAAQACGVMFNTFNGRFYGMNIEGNYFSSADTTHAHEPWFQALLDFFYVEG